MPNEQNKPGNGEEWSMPEPVFRSSEGVRLKKANTEQGEEQKMNEERNEAARETIDPEGETAVGKHDRGDRLGLSMTAVGLISLAVAAILFLLFYFLVFRTGGPEMP